VLIVPLSCVCVRVRQRVITPYNPVSICVHVSANMPNVPSEERTRTSHSQNMKRAGAPSTDALGTIMG
jgi:hypothetical protein